MWWIDKSWYFASAFGFKSRGEEMKELIIVAVLMFISGMMMYFVLGALRGIWALFITLPLACLVGYTSGLCLSEGLK